MGYLSPEMFEKVAYAYLRKLSTKEGEVHYVMTLIEMNPFSASATSSALFNWHKDLDKLWGKDDCEYPLYAYRSKPCQDLNHVTLLPAGYNKVIEDVLAKREADSKLEIVKVPLFHQPLPLRIIILNEGKTVVAEVESNFLPFF